MMIDKSAFAAWLDGYKAAWENRDPQRAADLFSDDATYRETPVDERVTGKAAIAADWAKAVAGQSDVNFIYDVIACEGDEGVCRWHVAFNGVPGGERIDLDGIFRCRFASEDKVDRFEEWWHIRVVPA